MSPFFEKCMQTKTQMIIWKFLRRIKVSLGPIFIRDLVVKLCSKLTEINVALLLKNKMMKHTPIRN